MWAWTPLLLIASYDAAGWSPRAARLAGFGVIGVGASGSVLAGLAADRVGRTRVAIWSLALSGACALGAGFFYSQPGLLTALCLVWGFAVIADSAQFSARRQRADRSPVRGDGADAADQPGLPPHPLHPPARSPAPGDAGVGARLHAPRPRAGLRHLEHAAPPEPAGGGADGFRSPVTQPGDRGHCNEAPSPPSRTTAVDGRLWPLGCSGAGPPSLRSSPPRSPGCRLPHTVHRDFAGDSLSVKYP